jgi:hypothetical protein
VVLPHDGLVREQRVIVPTSADGVGGPLLRRAFLTATIYFAFASYCSWVDPVRWC